VAWYVGNSESKTHPVGDKSPNELGIYDMSGNVWEWCQDTYKPYPCDSETIAESSNRVFRGGGWDYLPHNCRSAYRGRRAPDNRNIDLGFRLAASSF